MGTTRRSKGSGGVSFEHRGEPCRDKIRHRTCTGRWVGQAETGLKIGPDGKRRRGHKRVYGKTKTAVTDKLRELHDELAKGINRPAGAASYTVQQAVEAWLEHGMNGRAPNTIRKNRTVLAPLLHILGPVKLRELTAGEVSAALNTVAASYSSATLSVAHLGLKRAVRHAEAHDLVGRNVAELVDTPRGQEGRPSKSLTMAEAVAVIAAAKTPLPESKQTRPGLRDSRRPVELISAYIVLSLMVGVRTEEARALTWEHVHLDAKQPHVEVWRSVREHGDTKTKRSRRTIGLPQLAVEALRAWRKAQAAEQLAAGARWAGKDLVFASSIGTPLDSANVRKMFRTVCKAAGIGDFTPRELRTSFVSIMSEQGVPVEEIARLVGHAGGSKVTETVYRKELRPVITTGAEVMDEVFRAL
jgi:integrase